MSDEIKKQRTYLNDNLPFNWLSPINQLCAAYEAELTRLRADLAEAVRVMEPFAKLEQSISKRLEDYVAVAWLNEFDAVITGDLRAAAAFVASHK